MKTVLFVCAGNTCRSPMTEVIFNAKVAASPIWQKSGLVAKSAGTFAVSGANMAKNAQRALQELGFTVPLHRSQPFSKKLAEEASLILAMQDRVAGEVREAVPKAGLYTHTLGTFARRAHDAAAHGQYDVADPYGQSLEVYIACAREIAQYIDLALKRIEEEGLS